MLISPSLLSADFGNLQRDIDMINNSKADWFHLDIMDGVFVPNISFGFPVINAIQKYAKKPLDVHLMIVDPDRYIQRFRDLGAEYITVHYEACNHLHRTLQAIKACGAKAGVALNPHTPVVLLEDILCEADLVLIMSVNPGFGGQKFISGTYKKVKELKTMIIENNIKTLIEVDGGVDIGNAPLLRKAGVDALVVGNSLFTATDPSGVIATLKISI
ncbi:MAG: ribulose-phosphate 3-epimerase [Bacteroidota bacterium]